jgi:pimeloyl-ACP methyl ester carboxylesterase
MTTRDNGRSAMRSGLDRGLSRREVVGGAGVLALAAALTPTAASRAARAQVPGWVGQVTTSDGVNLHYLEAGSGKPILMIPGWSQTAEQFKYQLSGLSDRYRVIAVDMRRHGESDKPEYGYKISRLAKDTHDVIHALGLQDVNILGHSMGSSVIWNYYDMFGPERLASRGSRRATARHSSDGSARRPSGRRSGCSNPSPSRSARRARSVSSPDRRTGGYRHRNAPCRRPRA